MIQNLGLYNKLVWRSKRSILELDLILIQAIEKDVIKMFSLGELCLYEEILNFTDDMLLSLLQNRSRLTNIQHQNIIDKITKI